MSRNHYFPAVVSDACYAYESDTGPHIMVANTLPLCSRLAYLAYRHGLNQIWVMPDCALSHADPIMFSDLDPAIYDVRYAKDEPSPNQLQRMSRVTFWKREGDWEQTRYIEIIFLEQTTWPWELDTPDQVLEVITKLAMDLNCKIGRHPGGVGKQLLGALVSREHKVPPHVNLYAMLSHVDGAEVSIKCVRDFNWKAPDVELQEGWFLQGYDKNSLYPSAADNAALGVGDPAYYLCNNLVLKLQNGELPESVFKMNLAGLWRIEVTRPLIPDGSLPLGAFHYYYPWPLQEGQTWAYNPVIKCLLEMGCEVRLLEGYQWPNSKRVLGGWVKFLWGLRKAYKATWEETHDPVIKACYDSMKTIMNTTIGMLGNTDDLQREKEWKRGDWRETIRSLALGRMLYNVDKWAKEYGIFPVMVDCDCLYYVSQVSTPDCRLLQKSQELGGYKHAGTILITKEVIEKFESSARASSFRALLKEGNYANTRS